MQNKTPRAQYFLDCWRYVTYCQLQFRFDCVCAALVWCFLKFRPAPYLISICNAHASAGNCRQNRIGFQKKKKKKGSPFVWIFSAEQMSLLEVRSAVKVWFWRAGRGLGFGKSSRLNLSKACVGVWVRWTSRREKKTNLSEILWPFRGLFLDCLPLRSSVDMLPSHVCSSHTFCFVFSPLSNKQSGRRLTKAHRGTTPLLFDHRMSKSKFAYVIFHN